MLRANFRTYLPELLLNTLFFFILSAVILQLLTKAHLYQEQSALLKQAVNTCSEAAEYYRNGDGSLDDISKNYANSILVNHQILVYLSEDGTFCNRETGAYYMLVESTGSDTISIHFYEVGKDLVYSIENCCYTVTQEVDTP